MNHNVYVCDFELHNIQGYYIKARVQNSGLTHQDTRDIFEQKLEEDTPEVAKKKEAYFPLAFELERTNHFAVRSRIVPDSLWSGVQPERPELPTPQDYIFRVLSAGMVFREDCARILKQHRFGENIFTPVQIYDLTTGRLSMDETFYFLNLYERREYVCEVQTGPRITRFDKKDGGFYFSALCPGNGDINVSHSVLDCEVDLWVDPRLPFKFFMSARLHQALSQAGMIDKFSPRICKII